MNLRLFILFFFISAFNISLKAQSVTITSSASGSICAGTNVSFTAVASNISTPTYQWTKNGIAIAGAYSSTYSSTTLSNNDQIKVWVNAGIDNSKIVSNGLLLNLDASNPGSYSGTGNNWYDLSGNNNHATLMNSPTFDAVSKSVVTNGTNQYINIPSLNTSNSNITMQAWIYFDGSTRPGALIGAKNGYSIGKGNSAYDVAGNNLVLLLYGAAGGWKATGQSYSSSGWKLVTMTLDGSSTARAYIDGTLKYTYSGAAPSTPLGDLNLGAIPEDGYRYYDGKFAAAYFYNRALSLAEIQQNYD
ncbi:MAG: LamG domain-containing protein, partial [Chitinophagia bacterium]|nr:LamG domain-containing protein [Chitinophagia bacterium]